MPKTTASKPSKSVKSGTPGKSKGTGTAAKVAVNPVDALAEAKGITRDAAAAMVEATIRSALVRKFGPTVLSEITLEPEIQIMRLQNVVDFVTDPVMEVSLADAQALDESFTVGDVLETTISPADFGRYAIASAKQRIRDAGRHADRSAVRQAWSAKLGDLVTATVLSARGPAYMLRVANIPAEVVLSARDTLNNYEVGAHLEAALVSIEDTPSGPRLVLSQTAPEYVVALFARHSDAVQSGRVRVVASGREAGVMTKIVVDSEEGDPVSLYVGPQARAARQVAQDLGAERIDVVAFSRDAETMIRRAMEPAEPLAIDLSADGKSATVTIAPSEMGRAMGRKKANVRLASKVSGYHLVLTEGKPGQKVTRKPAAKAVEAPLDMSNPPLRALGLSSAVVALLSASGYSTLEDILDVEASDLSEAGLSVSESDAVLNLLDELTAD